MSDTDLTPEESQALEAMQEKEETPDAEEVQGEGQEEVKASESDEPAEEKQPEFKSTRKEEKPPEGFVPHQAMHAERMKRQELERKIEALEAAINGPKQEEAPKWVDPLEDPEGYRKYDEWSRQQAQKRLDAFEEQQKQTQAQQQRFAEAQRLEQEFTAQTPDYPQAAQFLHQQRIGELRGMGYGDQEIAQQIAKDANGLFDAAKAAGMNPAELLYIRAQRAGYSAVQPEKEQEKIVQLADAQQKTQGVGASGGRQAGRLTADALASMSDAEFDKAMRERPDEVRRAMGG